MLKRHKIGVGLIILYLSWSPGILSARSSSVIPQRAAVLRSLLVPGWGQYVLGAEEVARGFMVAEAGLWIGYYLASETAQWYQQNYRAFAALHAGTDYTLKSDIYYFWLGQYDSIQDYNTEQIRRRDLDSIYPTENGCIVYFQIVVIQDTIAGNRLSLGRGLIWLVIKFSSLKTIR